MIATTERAVEAETAKADAKANAAKERYGGPNVVLEIPIMSMSDTMSGFRVIFQD